MRMFDLPTSHIYRLRIIALGGLHRNVTEQELNLLQFAAGRVAHFRA